MTTRRAAPAPELGPRARAYRIGTVALVLLAAFGVALPQQLVDPFLRHDDYPVMLGLADLYWWKTFAKGRWVTWLWALRPWPRDPQAVMLLFLAVWCVAAAAMGVGMFRHDRRPWRAGLAAAAMAAMPQMAFIAPWPAATLPALAALAAVALAAALGSARTCLWVLVLAVPLGAMAHTTSPLLMLMAVAAAGPPMSGRFGPLAPVAAFAAGLALAAPTILALNLLVHGAASVETQSWLDERPATDVTALLANLRETAAWTARTVMRMTLGAPLAAMFLIGLALLAALSLAATDRRTLLRLALAFGVAFGIGLAPTLLQGIDTPARATGHVWMLPVALLALALREAATRLRAVVFALALALLAAGAAPIWPAFFERMAPPYQAWTRDLAHRIARAGGAPGETLLVRGQVHGVREALLLQSSTGLGFRLQALTGLEVHLCAPQSEDRLLAVGEAPELARPHYAAWQAFYAAAARLCAEHEAGFAALPRAGTVARIAPGVMGLRLPDLRIADHPP